MKNILKIACVILIFCCVACSIFEDDESFDYSDIDYLFGVEESGRLKKELHYSGTEDETVNTDIEFIYINDKLIKKVYTDHRWNEPFILQKDTFLYADGKLIQMLHYFRRGEVSSPLIVSEIYTYSYPGENTMIEVVREETGELDDSVKYIYSGDLLIEERHNNHLGEWGSKYEYNADGKLYKSSDLDGRNLTINYFDENGLLKSSASIDNDGINVLIAISYERETKGDRLVLRKYIKDIRVNTVEPILRGQKTFENGKLVEQVIYHSSFISDQCYRYKYY
ncbi:hypothetical protein OU798_14935 [Prolixibacteraceae bacterium Z1-6]|uniref:Uncharacterized protein n=1 Tax=Draconibacterium aestuarii TaxID=2998507 RepID=A0A9X3J6N7_9BACT|nr:hypothetical protein [Prolixibacteraceae bacterium Z1-6]